MAKLFSKKVKTCATKLITGEEEVEDLRRENTLLKNNNELLLSRIESLNETIQSYERVMELMTEQLQQLQDMLYKQIKEGS